MAVNKYIIQLIVDTGSGQAKVKGVASAFDDLDRKVKRSTDALEKNNAAMKKGAGSAGIAGAATAEFGRLISDMPYGISAITNNLSQLGSMFALLVTSAGSVKEAFKAMWTTMMGPTGILIAFQAVVAAIDFFSRKNQKAQKEATEFNLQLDLQVKGLKAVIDALQDSNTSEEDRIKLLEKTKEIGDDIVDAYKKEALSKEELVKLAEQEIVILEAKERLSKKQKDIEKDIEVLKGELLKIADTEEKAQRRKMLLMRKGLSEEEATKEINMQLVSLGGKQYNQKTSLVDVAERRAEIERKIEVLAKGQEEAYDQMLEAQREAQKIRTAAEQRISAEKDLFDETISLRRELIEEELNLLKDSELRTTDSQRDLQKKLYSLTLQRLEDEKRREQQIITDPETLKLIEEKYRILAEKAGIALRDGLRSTFEEPLEVESKGAVFGKDLIEKPLTESQKAAKTLLDKFRKDTSDDFLNWAESTDAARNGDPKDDWFLKKTGMTPETFEKRAKMVQQGLDATFGLLDAQMQRELAMEQAKTIGVNDQLRARLRNEKLTAQERDKINQEISKNEALLVEKQNKIEEKRFKLNKAQGIANAVINTAVGVSKVLPNIPLAAFIGALGAAQIATIASQKFVPTAAPAPSLSAQDGPAESQGPAFNVIGGTITSQLAQAVAGSKAQPVKAYVVAGEVTTAQALERNKIKEAGI